MIFKHCDHFQKNFWILNGNWEKMNNSKLSIVTMIFQHPVKERQVSVLHWKMMKMMTETASWWLCWSCGDVDRRWKIRSKDFGKEIS